MEMTGLDSVPALPDHLREEPVAARHPGGADTLPGCGPKTYTRALEPMPLLLTPKSSKWVKHMCPADAAGPGPAVEPGTPNRASYLPAPLSWARL